MTQPKKGDLITIQTEDVDREYESKPFEKIKVRIQDEVNEFKDLADLFKKSIYKIVKDDFHEDIVAAGGTAHYYTIKGEKIESIVSIDEGRGVKINGEYDVIFGASRTPFLSEAHFLSDIEAQALATTMNKRELKRAIELQKAIDKVIITLGQIVDKALV